MASRLRCVGLAVAGALAVIAGADGAHAEIAVAAGHSVSLMTMSSIDQACHPLGPVTVNVISPPQGGFLAITQVKTYPNFNALNTRSRCNTLKLPATQVIYQSSGTFLGLDIVTIEAIFPGGDVKRIRIPVSVRPVAPGYVGAAGIVGGDAGHGAGPDTGRRAGRTRTAEAEETVPTGPRHRAPVKHHAKTAAPAQRSAAALPKAGNAPPHHPQPRQTPVKSPLVNI
jgi:hypothetical protein